MLWLEMWLALASPRLVQCWRLEGGRWGLVALASLLTLRMSCWQKAGGLGGKDLEQSKESSNARGCWQESGGEHSDEPGAALGYWGCDFSHLLVSPTQGDA